MPKRTDDIHKGRVISEESQKRMALTDAIRELCELGYLPEDILDIVKNQIQIIKNDIRLRGRDTKGLSEAEAAKKLGFCVVCHTHYRENRDSPFNAPSPK